MVEAAIDSLSDDERERERESVRSETSAISRSNMADEDLKDKD